MRTPTFAREGASAFLAVLAFAFGIAGANPAVAESDIPASLDGVTLRLPIPAGYCGLETKNPAEATLFDTTAKALAASGNRLLGIAVNCKDLEAVRAGRPSLGHYMEFMTTLANGVPAHVADSERAQYFSQLSATVPKLDVKSATDLANKGTQSVGVSTNISRFGIVAQDDTALYIGAVATYNNGAPLADVMGMTTAGGRAVSAAFYLPYVDTGTLTSLLEEARHEARAIIAANASGGPKPQK